MKRFLIIISLLLSAVFMSSCSLFGGGVANLEFELLSNDTYGVKEEKSKAKEIVIPETYNDKKVTKIITFKESTHLVKVTIPNSVTEIGERAFDGCTSLSDIAIPNSVTEIGDYAFVFCSSLKNITIPSSVTSISNDMFLKCTSLNNVSLPNGLISIGDNAFDKCTSLSTINIPDTVTTIGNGAFMGCSALTDINIPNSVTEIGGSIFSDCNKLNYNTYDNAYYLGNSSNPYLCLIKGKNKEITSCEIKDTCKFISSSSFESYKSLTNVSFPESITFVGDRAFYNCKALSKLTLNDNITYVGIFAFKDCDKSLYNLYDNAYYLGTKDNVYFCLVQGIDKNITSCEVNINCRMISGGAFRTDTLNFLNTVNIKTYRLTFIGDDAFSSCPITKIDIPGAVTYLGSGAFSFTGLVKLELDCDITFISDYAFAGCKSLTNVTILCSDLTAIGKKAFAWCDSLQEINYINTISKWNSLKIAEDWIEDTPAKISCIDGYPE